MGRGGVKCIKILPDLRPGTSERLLIRNVGVAVVCLIIIAFRCTKRPGFGRRGEVGTRGGEAEAGRRCWR